MLALFCQERCEKFLEQANNIESANLDTEDFVTLALLKDQLTTYIEGYRWREWV